MPLEDTQTAVRAGWKMRKNKETVAYRYIYTSMHMNILTHICLYVYMSPSIYIEQVCPTQPMCLHVRKKAI